MMKKRFSKGFLHKFAEGKAPIYIGSLVVKFNISEGEEWGTLVVYLQNEQEQKEARERAKQRRKEYAKKKTKRGKVGEEEI